MEVSEGRGDGQGSRESRRKMIQRALKRGWGDAVKRGDASIGSALCRIFIARNPRENFDRAIYLRRGDAPAPAPPPSRQFAQQTQTERLARCSAAQVGVEPPAETANKPC
jgi:hypothetical protein